MLDYGDEDEDGEGERKERRRKDSGASEQPEEEVIVQLCSCMAVFYGFTTIIKENIISLFSLSMAGWPKEDCQPILIHRESHTDPRQWKHQHRSSGTIVTIFFLPWRSLEIFFS